MPRILLGGLLLLLCSFGLSWGLDIPEMVVTTAVEDRAPVDTVAVVPAEDTRLYCFARVVGVEGQGHIAHVWYRGDKVMARVELPVRSNDWRTWSSKRLLASWQGAWRVEAQDEQGEVLQSVSFTVR